MLRGLSFIGSWRNDARRALFVGGVLLALVVGAPPAFAGGMGAVVRKAVRGHYRELHACFRKSLAEDRKRGGTVFLKVTLGRHGAVAAVKVARDELGSKRTARCLEARVKGWVFPGAEAVGASAGSDLYLPLTFRGDSTQRAVAAIDAGWPPPAGEGRIALLTAANAGTAGLRLSLIRTRRPLGSLAARGQIVVLLSGSVRFLGRSLKTGLRAAYLSLGSRARMVPQGRVDLLTLDLPAGGTFGKRSVGLRPLSERGRRFRGHHWAVRSLRLLPRHRRHHYGGKGRVFLYVISGSAKLGGKVISGAAGLVLRRGHAVYFGARQKVWIQATEALRAVEFTVQ
ncbi:MAG: AgmX/PglI C-terminal domain-containing protein [Deltaproteobacteria bacterium]|nr:AgmX/PglI C-terminal domain-containing protein [Deltaproteobacteria bacterium]